jgi:hypothetical protein
MEERESDFSGPESGEEASKEVNPTEVMCSRENISDEDVRDFFSTR